MPHLSSPCTVGGQWRLGEGEKSNINHIKRVMVGYVARKKNVRGANRSGVIRNSCLHSQ